MRGAEKPEGPGVHPSARSKARGTNTHAIMVLITISLIFSQMASLLTPFWVR